MKWVGLPYPVSNLTGRARAAPRQLGVQEHAGSNGQAVISGSGKVEQVAPQPAQGRPPPQGREPAVRQPVAASVTAGLAEDHGHDRPVRLVRRGRDDPGGAGQPDFYHLVIDPGAISGIKPRFQRVPRPKVDPGGMIEMRMEDVKGRFIFDNGIVKMLDVGFKFHDAPVKFAQRHGRRQGQRCSSSSRSPTCGRRTSGSTAGSATRCRRSWPTSPAGSTRGRPSGSTATSS